MMEPGHAKPPAPGNVSFVETSLRAGGVPPRKALTLSALGILLIAVLIGTAWLLNRQPQAAAPRSQQTTGQIAHTPAATWTPEITATPVGAVPPGWQADPDLDTITTIVTAPSQPATAYGCGSADGKIRFITSQDGGATWSSPEGIAPGYRCLLTVNPLNALQLAVEILPCQLNSCTSTQTYLLFRSNDGGATWQGAALPGATTNAGFAGDMAWTADALFVALESTGTSHTLAVSVNGGPLTWVDNGRLSNHDYGVITLIYGLGNTIYAGIQPLNGGGGSACGLPPAVQLYASADHGASWAPADSAFSFAGQTVTVVSAELQTVIGVEGANNTFVISHDAAQTWQILPSMGGLKPCSLLAAPNGAIFEDLAPQSQGDVTTLAQGIYELAPQSQTWTPLYQSFYDLGILGVSCDGIGAPVRVWGSEYNPTTHTAHTILYQLKP